MDKITCLFPFSEEAMLMLKNKQLISEYSLKYTGSIPGYSNGFINEICDCDVEYIDMWDDYACNQFDVIIVPEEYNDTMNKDIKKRLSLLESRGKEIVRIGSLNTCANNSIKEVNEILPIFACVILITGLGSHTQKSELSIELYKRFKEDDVMTEVISPYMASSIMGFHKFPSFMYCNDIDEHQKMLKFNRFIKDIDLTNPDVIIICVPEGVMPYPDEMDITNCGIMNFMISTVVPPDYVCCNLYAKEYSNYELKEIVETCEKKVGKQIDSLMFSDFAIDWIAYNDILQDEGIQFFPLSPDIVDRYVNIARENMELVNVNSMRDISNLYNNIMHCLHMSSRNYQIL